MKQFPALDPAWIQSKLEDCVSQLSSVSNSGVPGVTLNPAAITEAVSQDFSAYLDLLLAWGEKMDLVAPAPIEQQFNRHFVDCFAADTVLRGKLQGELLDNDGMADVGSGAGFPGLVFAILHRDAPVTLIEPRDKRCIFLAEVRRKLALENVQIVQKRFEELKAFPQPVRLVVSRALGAYPQFVNTGTKLLQTGRGGFVSALVGDSFAIAEKDKNMPPPTLIPYHALDEGPRHAIALWRC